MSSLYMPNFDPVASSMPKLKPIFHFLQVNPLVQGLKLLEGPPSLPHIPNCTYETRGFFFD